MHVRDTAAARASRAGRQLSDVKSPLTVLESANVECIGFTHCLHNPIEYSPERLLLLVPLRAPLRTLPSTTRCKCCRLHVLNNGVRSTSLAKRIGFLYANILPGSLAPHMHTSVSAHFQLTRGNEIQHYIQLPGKTSRRVFYAHMAANILLP